MKRIVSLLVLGTSLGCGAATAVAPTDRLIVSLPAAKISVPRGTRTSIGAAVTREGGAQSTISITVDAPAAVTVSVATESTLGNTTTATLAVTVSSTAAQGSYIVVIHGHAAGYPDASAQLEIDLPDPPPP